MSDDIRPYPNLANLHWHEGLFLRPHHLQWSAREAASHLRYWQTLGRPGAYGVRRFVYDETAIRKDQLAISVLDAVLFDGSIVQFPGNIASLDPLKFKEAMETSKDGQLTVYLCVPRYDDRKANTGNSPQRPGAVGAPPRWTIRPQTVRDENTGERELEIDVRQVRATLELRDRTGDGFESLPLLRVMRGSVAEGISFVDDSFCPPLAAAFRGSMPQRKAEKVLMHLDDKIKELKGFFTGVANASFLTANSRIEDLLQYQACIVGRARLGTLLACPDPDPFALYLELVGLLGNLTALSGEAPAVDFEPYEPRDPGRAFGPAFDLVEHYLDQTRSAEIPLQPLTDMGDGTWTIDIRSEWLSSPTVAFCVALETRAEREKIQEVPFQVKVGTQQRVRSYADRALTPVPLSALPSVPAGARKGLNYFHVQHRQHAAAKGEWDRMVAEGKFALFSKIDFGPGTRFYLCVLERGL